MKHDRLIWVALLLLSAAYYVPIIKLSLNVYDEGLVLAGAERVLQGQRPHVDFWSIYPPGQYYTLAFLFKLFGSSVLVERVYDIVIKSLLSTFSFLIVRQLGFSNTVALVTWGLSLIWIGMSAYPAYPAYAALLFIFVSAYLFLRYTDRNTAHWLIYSGLMVTVGAMFRHDLAGLAAAAMLLTLVLRRVTDSESGWRPVFSYALGVLLVAVPISIYLISAVGIEPMVDQSIRAPAEIMSRYRSLPYPTVLSTSTIQFFLFPLILVLTLFSSLALIIKKKMRCAPSYGVFLLSLMGTLFINQLRVRSDNVHLVPVALVSIILVPCLFSLLTSSVLSKLGPRARWAAGIGLFLVLSMPFIKPVEGRIESFSNDYLAAPARSPIARAGYAGTSVELQDLVTYVQNSTAPNEAIYVGVSNHDQFIVNEVAIYFLTARDYGTKYHELHPGITTERSIQEEIIGDLEDSFVRAIVLAPDYWPEPNQTMIDSKTNLLDDYISVNYEMIKTYGSYEVWLRKP
jgi:hypothetical protein